MDNHNSYGGISQHSAAHNSHNTQDFKDPLDYLKDEKHKKDSENIGFWHRFLFHEEINSREKELQFLNSGKSDKGGTSVGISDANLRFLALKSHGIIRMSMLSLFFSIGSFFGLFIFMNQLTAVIVSALILVHTFFPGYIIYGMQRFVDGDKFTKPFFQKFITVWRVFEILYVCFTAGVIYLSRFDWNLFIDYVKSYQIKTKIFKKIVLVILDKFHPEQLVLMLSVYGMILLLGILLYLVVMYKRIKWAKKIQKSIKFEHLKEVKRPAQLARIKSGKVRE